LRKSKQIPCQKRCCLDCTRVRLCWGSRSIWSCQNPLRTVKGVISNWLEVAWHSMLPVERKVLNIFSTCNVCKEAQQPKSLDGNGKYWVYEELITRSLTQ